MEIQSVELDLEEVAAAFDPPSDRDESKVHVSELRDALLETLGVQKPPESETPQWVKNLGSFGLIWEKVLWESMYNEAVSQDLHFKKGTIVLEQDGIIGSLDGLLYPRAQINRPDSQKPTAVWENKTRWHHDEIPIDNEKYMIQAKAYCWMAGVRQCWFPVLNISSRPPNMRQWLHIIEFTAQELMDNWKSLLLMKPMMEKRKFGERENDLS